MPDMFTDYVLTFEGPYSQVVWDHLEHEVLPAMQRWVGDGDVGLASHEWNQDGVSFHSLLARNEILATRLEDLLAERTELLARVDAQSKALKKEFDRG